MRVCLALLLPVAYLLIRTPDASAWNEIGHAVVSLIAFDELAKEDPQLPLRVFEMLKKHPHYERYLGFNRPRDANAAAWALMRAANWADWVRPPFREGVKADLSAVRFHRAFDHFINLPIVETSGANAYAGKPPMIDPERPDILSAYRGRMGDLNENLAAAEDKAVAVCWIAHLVGDIHQPLHASTYFSKQFPEGDLGGNRFGVRINGTPVRLHTYWDNLLGEVPGWDQDTADHQVLVYSLVVKNRETLRDPKYSRAALRDQLEKNTTFASWIDESYELAKLIAYRDGDKPLAGVNIPSRGNVPADAPAASPDYERSAQEVARRRIALAGYRLADRLKLILEKQAAK
jgi:hypothetical protein